jgi:hypothetical protein
LRRSIARLARRLADVGSSSFQKLRQITPLELLDEAVASLHERLLPP